MVHDFFAVPKVVIVNGFERIHFYMVHYILGIFVTIENMSDVLRYYF